ncbi:MAG: DUF3373 family protein, partial [Halobacteriovoraceae bacterium]|nr:DUF3373 family protein [Halobacteriovoraceae bacterium]
MKLLITLFVVYIVSPAYPSDLVRRVENLEAERVLNIFSFNGEFRTQYFKIKNPRGEMLDLYRLNSFLGVNANISPKIKFYSRYVMSKYFNLYTEENRRPINDDLALGSRYDGTNVKVERAYFDYFFDVPLVLTVGRLPTFGGEPLNYYDGLPAQSTYPIMAYSVEMDGVALTYDFYNILPRNHQFSLRAIYTPFSHLNYNSGFFPLSIPTGMDGGKATSEMVGTLAAEYLLKNRRYFLDEWGFKFFYTKLDGVTFEDVILPPLPQAGIANPTPLLQFPDKMFDLELTSFSGQLLNVGKMGLDIHASLTYSKVVNHKLASLAGGATLGLRSNTVGEVSAKSMLITLKQKLPFPSLRNPSFGLEYFKGERNFVTPTVFGNYEDVTGFYSTMGSAWHVFSLWPIENQLSLRLGYRHQHSDYKVNRINLF